ncbi:hypothetical protein BDW68DRAFT_182443 [Aspergillus falconensis]
MAKTISAFKRLREAIDLRIASNTESTFTNLPWHEPVTLTQDCIPPSSFAHEFLSAVSHYKVRFRYIAPRIRFPTIPEFLDQVMTDFRGSPYTYMGMFPGDCPLPIFLIDAEELVYDKNYQHHPMPAGLYINRVVVRHPQFWNNGCKLLLPFGIGANGWARQSNGQSFGQSGCPDGFTFRHYVQIHKVLENWAERVEKGDWKVNGDAVAGGIEKFRGADTEEHWQKYWIPRSW